jgi:hypothetical protein
MPELRRKHSRKRLRLAVRYGARRADLRGYTADLSSQGIAIKTNQVFQPGAQLVVRLDTGNAILVARGRVRWARQVPALLMAHTHCGMGIEFTAISRRFQQYLRSLDKGR